jgi:periplasmic divalent cation tolerance protein
VTAGTDVRVVLMTAADADAAERLGAALVEARLATCANVVPGLASIYWWEGKVERADEALLVLKTVEGCVEALRARAVELHAYDVPEFLVLDVTDGHEPYLAWVRAENRPEGRAGERAS